MFNALLDLKNGLKQWHLWLYLAKEDLYVKYKQTTLSYSWEPISFLIVVLVLGPLYSILLQKELLPYIVYLSCGLAVWKFFSGVISTSGSVFYKNKSILSQIKVEYTIFIFQNIATHSIIFLINISLALILIIYVYGFNTINYIHLFLGLLLLLFTMIFFCLFLSIVCLRFRDVQSIIDSVLRIAFFATPVIWDAANIVTYSNEVQSGNFMRITYLFFNPFYHMIEIVRAPLIGDTVNINSIYFLLIILSSLIISSLALYAKYKNKITLLV